MMTDDLISRKKMAEDFEECNDRSHKWTPERVKGLIYRQPTVDAIPVVRCRECKYHNKPPCPMRLSFNWTEDDDFCSYGELKEGAE